MVSSSVSSSVSFAHVLVPTDGSPLATAAAATAQAAAGWFGAQLAVVSVAATSAELDSRADHVEALADALGVAPEARWAVIESSPARGIAVVARDLSKTLVCVASHGHGRSAALLGSVAESLVAELAAPVLVVGPHGEVGPAGAPVVAAFDGGEVSSDVLAVAAAWADALGVALCLVTVAEPLPDAAPTATSAHGTHRSIGPQDPDAYLAALAERVTDLAGEGTPVVATATIEDPIGPASGLAAWLADHPAQLVVATTHSRSGLRRALIGSSAASIVHRCPVPVLLVPLSEA